MNMDPFQQDPMGGAVVADPAPAPEAATLPSVLLCPAGPMSTASARLRCHALGRELARLGCAVRTAPHGDPSGEGLGSAVPDVLVVQKCASAAIVALASRVRRQGGCVVFDIDDWGDALPWVQAQPQLLADLLAQVSVVTVDTDVRAEVLAKEAAYAQVPAFWVVPDPVDYVDAPAPPLAARALPRRVLSGCWFGNGPNLPPALPYVQAGLSSGRVGRFAVITNAQFVPQMREAWPMLDLQAWQLETFAERLREHDFCLLVHDSNLEGVQKSNNKMLAALAQGVVPLVSNTPAYAELAVRIGVPELVLNAPEDLAERLAPGQLDALRARIQGPACRQVLDTYMPATVARDFLHRLQALRSAARPPAAPARAGNPAATSAATPAATHAAKPTLPAQSAPLAAAPVKLNLGCGDMLLPGYVNVDVATERRGHQPDVCCDVRDLQASFPDNHADEVMAIHVIEHFWRWEVVAILKEWVRVLKPGGTLVLECPNLLAACEALLKSPETAARPDQNGSRTMWCFYGDPSWRDPLMCHRWLYTPQSLAEVMHEAGLRQLAQRPPLFKARHPRDMRIEGVKPLA